MKKPDEESSVLQLHEDPAFFREAVIFTAAETRFLARLIEKDYFCSLLLSYLASSDRLLVFKGGTCLAKVHTGFYRLSEDLDFAIPSPVNASRTERRSLSSGLKDAITRIPGKLSVFRLVEPLTGTNNSTQYGSVIGYTSLINRQQETIKIEVGLREPLLTHVHIGAVRTIMLNPVSGRPILPELSVPCLSLNEAMAEKLRAALTRREAAIRDFYDIDYAVRKLSFLPLDKQILELVRQKLAVPGNDPVDVSRERLETLRRQVDAELRPVLRTVDFAEFDLDRVFTTMAKVAVAVR